MADLIDRQAAIKEIARWIGYIDEDMILRIQTGLKKMPSAEPEIIRCKDCEHWDTSWQNDYSPNYHYCPLVDGTRRDDFYCADAERRTDG